MMMLMMKAIMVMIMIAYADDIIINIMIRL